MNANATSKAAGSKLKVIVVIVAVIILLGAAKYFHVQDLLRSSLDWVSSLGPWGVLIFIAIYISIFSQSSG
jgi:uncharacterized membrane protein YdjX (TVP38/TMEM64 family)